MEVDSWATPRRPRNDFDNATGRRGRGSRGGWNVCRQSGVPEVPTMQALEHPFPTVFIGEHDIREAARGAQGVERWTLGTLQAGRETRHRRMLANYAVPRCTPLHTLQHGRCVRRVRLASANALAHLWHLQRRMAGMSATISTSSDRQSGHAMTRAAATRRSSNGPAAGCHYEQR